VASGRCGALRPSPAEGCSRAFEDAGADQVLFAGTVTEGTEQLERISALLGL